MTDNACPICQDSLHGELSVGCTVPCGHLFHRHCFETWQIHSRSGRKCPCCNIKMTGFIDKIHISLPSPTPAEFLEEQAAQLKRRKSLSNEKARRSAAMRHQARRRSKSFPECASQDDKDEARDDVTDSHQNETAAKRTSLSAVLQRIPEDPIKGKCLNDAYFDYPEQRLSTTGSHDSDISSMRYLAAQISDVTDKVTRNIELSLRPTPSMAQRKQQPHQRQQKQQTRRIAIDSDMFYMK